jgi:hypothetical protein
MLIETRLSVCLTLNRILNSAGHCLTVTNAWVAVGLTGHYVYVRNSLIILAPKRPVFWGFRTSPIP